MLVGIEHGTSVWEGIRVLELTTAIIRVEHCSCDFFNYCARESTCMRCKLVELKRMLCGAHYSWFASYCKSKILSDELSVLCGSERMIYIYVKAFNYM